MILRGLDQINGYLASVKARNLNEWYLNHPEAVRENAARRERNPHPTRSQQNYMIRQAKRDEDERRSQEYANQQMHDAMGHDMPGVCCQYCH